MTLAFGRRRGLDRAGVLLPAAAVLAFGAVAAALYTQHVWGMQPCSWCVLQRLIYLTLGGVALVGWAAGQVLAEPLARVGRLVGGTLVLMLAVCGMAAALWQHFVAAKSTSCVGTLADRIIAATRLEGPFPEVFAAYASCADGAVDLFGLRYEWWSLALFTLLALLAVRALRHPD